MVREIKTVKKVFVEYGKESETELTELKKLKLMVSNGKRKEKKVFISIDKPTVIEVRVYDLSNFSVTIFDDFNRKVKKLIR